MTTTLLHYYNKGFKFFQIVKEGKKRKLVINGAKLEDAGKITVKSNADEASAPLGVKCETDL